ncbi:hypothetical protein CR513_01838, partial [Mucuna pruriens]
MDVDKNIMLSCHFLHEPIIYLVNGQHLWTITKYLDVLSPPITRMLGKPKKIRNKEPIKGWNQDE